YGVEVELRIADRFRVADPQHSHVDLLCQIGGLGFRPDAPIEVPLQRTAVLCKELLDERLSLLGHLSPAAPEFNSGYQDYRGSERGARVRRQRIIWASPLRRSKKHRPDGPGARVSRGRSCLVSSRAAPGLLSAPPYPNGVERPSYILRNPFA